MSFLRQLWATAAYIGFIITGNPWFLVEATAVSSYDARLQRKRANAAARDAYNRGLKDRQLMLDILADAPRTMVLGRVRTVEGVRRRFVSGENSETLVMVVSFAGHEIDGFEKFWFDDVELTLDEGGYVQTLPYASLDSELQTLPVTLDSNGGGTFTVQGPVVSATVRAFARDDNGGALITRQLTASGSGTTITVSGGIPEESVILDWQRTIGNVSARIRPFLGTADQNIGAILAAEYPSAPITADDKFAGIACVILELTFDQNVFPTGIPGLTALIRGAKVFDPRKVEPSSSNAHDINDPSTWQWSENPALLAYHYARHPNGWAVPAEEIRTDDVIAAADACDVETVFTERFPDNSTETVTLPRHRCGITISLDGDPRSAMDDIMASMGGRWGWAGGTWRFRAAVMSEPVFSLSDAVLAYRLDENGQIDDEPVIRAVAGTPREQRATRVTGSCVMPQERWQVLPFPAVEDPVLIAKDGQPLPLEVPFAGVTHPAHAQYLGSVLIRESQAGLRIEARCNVSAWTWELFDVGTVDLPRLGMSEKTVEVLSWRWSPATGVDVTLAEITDAIFDPAAELRGIDPAPNTAPPPVWSVPAITGLSLSTESAVLPDGTIAADVTISWDAITAASVTRSGWVEVGWLFADDESDLQIVRADSLTEHVLRGLPPERAVAVQVRAVNAIPVRGAWSESETIITAGDVTPPAAPAGLNYINSVAGMRVGWNAPPERDYLESELRVGASYEAGITLYVGSGTSHTWVPTSDADYTLWLVHRDRSRNDSGPVSLLASWPGAGPLTFFVFVSHIEPASEIDSNVYVRLNSDGTIDTRAGSGGSYVPAGNWYTPTTAGIGDDYDARVAVSGDSLAFGTVGSRQTLSTSPEWRLEQPVSFSYAQKSATLTIEILNLIDETPESIGTASMVAGYEPGL
jgi:hypothetical protein